jgi:hypothetical protein
MRRLTNSFAIAVILALALAFLGSYLVVASQTPASTVDGSAEVYGPVGPLP